MAPQPQSHNASPPLSALQVVLLFTVAGLGIAGLYFLLSRATAPQAAPVAKIGDYSITQEQLRLRQDHANIYYPGSGTPEVALAQLIQGYLAATVLKQQGVALDHATWLAEEERIDKQTKDPATLAKIKYVYGTRHDDYLYIGILPDFAQSRLFKLFRSTPSFAMQAQREAGVFLDGVEANPARFSIEAAKLGLTVRRLVVDPEKRMLPAGEELKVAVPAVAASPRESQLRAEMQARAGEQELEAAKSLLERLAGLAPGEVYGNTLETPESFEVVRLVSRGNGTAVVEMAGFAKPDFGKWFWGEAAKVPVYVKDNALKQGLIERVGWAKQLTFL